MGRYAPHLLVAVLAALDILTAQAREAQPPNILLLYADDWRHDTLGCAGTPVVRTPHLDALAAAGVRFTQSYVTTSICGVSRASLLTGQWMSRHGNRAFAMFQTPWEQTFPALLRSAGYHVGHVGKWHNGSFPSDKYDFGRAYHGEHWLRNEDGSRVHVTEQNLQDGLEFLDQRPRGKPFCLTVAFFAAHAEDAHPKQYLPQPGSMAWYQDDIVPGPKTLSEGHINRLPPFLSSMRNEGRRRWALRFDTPERYQISMKNYYRLVSEVDAACGRLIKVLKRQGELQRTLVVFTTDNGYFHGEHGLADKWYPYEESVRVPLIVCDPRMPADLRGSVRSEVVLNVDLAPSILRAAGVEIPQSMQGCDLSDLYLVDQPRPWRTDFYYEHPTIDRVDFIPSSEAVIAKDVKYIFWPDYDVEQLFDLTADPHEERDLVENPAFEGRRKALRERLNVLRTAAQ
jgi:arylsulfatase